MATASCVPGPIPVPFFRVPRPRSAFLPLNQISNSTVNPAPKEKLLTEKFAGGQIFPAKRVHVLNPCLAGIWIPDPDLNAGSVHQELSETELTAKVIKIVRIDVQYESWKKVISDFGNGKIAFVPHGTNNTVTVAIYNVPSGRTMY